MFRADTLHLHVLTGSYSILRVAKRDTPAARIAATRSGGMNLHASIAHVLGTPSMREPTAALGHRELEVLDHLREGKSNRAIAASLGITERTARTHVRHILAKLGVESRTQAALLASPLRSQP